MSTARYLIGDVRAVLAVATGHGRDAIGIDLDARNAELALQRVGPLLLTVEDLRPVADGAA